MTSSEHKTDERWMFWFGAFFFVMGLWSTVGGIEALITGRKLPYGTYWRSNQLTPPRGLGITPVEGIVIGLVLIAWGSWMLYKSYKMRRAE